MMFTLTCHFSDQIILFLQDCLGFGPKSPVYQETSILRGKKFWISIIGEDIWGKAQSWYRSQKIRCWKAHCFQCEVDKA